jgi:hypothetical protein
MFEHVLRVTYKVRYNEELKYSEFYAVLENICAYFVYIVREHIFDSKSDALARDIVTEDERKIYGKNIEILYTSEFLHANSGLNDMIWSVNV